MLMMRDYCLRNDNDAKHFVARIIRMSAGFNYISDNTASMNKIIEESFN